MAPAAPHMEIHRDIGDGPPVVLIHGFPDTAATWDTIADAVADAGHRVIVPHLRGYTPASIRPGRRYRSRDLAEDLIGLLDDLSIEQATLAGHDWGASMALGAASLSPERVSQLVPIAIPHQRDLAMTPKMALDARHFLQLKLPWAAAQFRLRDFHGVDVLYDRWAPNWSGPSRDECVRSVKAAFAAPDVLDAALAYYRDLSLKPDKDLTRRIACPTLLIGGDSDIVPAALFRNSGRGFTGPLDVEVYPGAGHWPHREAEDQFIPRLLNFLAD